MQSFLCTIHSDRLCINCALLCLWCRCYRHCCRCARRRALFTIRNLRLPVLDLLARCVMYVCTYMNVHSTTSVTACGDKCRSYVKIESNRCCLNICRQFNAKYVQSDPAQDNGVAMSIDVSNVLRSTSLTCRNQYASPTGVCQLCLLRSLSYMYQHFFVFDLQWVKSPNGLIGFSYAHCAYNWPMWQVWKICIHTKSLNSLVVGKNTCYFIILVYPLRLCDGRRENNVMVKWTYVHTYIIKICM